MLNTLEAIRMFLFIFFLRSANNGFTFSKRYDNVCVFRSQILSHDAIEVASIFFDHHIPNNIAMDCNLRNRNSFQHFHNFHHNLTGMLFHSSHLNLHSCSYMIPDNYFDTANYSCYNKCSVYWIMNFQCLHKYYCIQIHRIHQIHQIHHILNNMDNNIAYLRLY